MRLDKCPIAPRQYRPRGAPDAGGRSRDLMPRSGRSRRGQRLQAPDRSCGFLATQTTLRKWSSSAAFDRLTCPTLTA